MSIITAGVVVLAIALILLLLLDYEDFWDWLYVFISLILISIFLFAIVMFVTDQVRWRDSKVECEQLGYQDTLKVDGNYYCITYGVEPQVIRIGEWSD